MTSPLDVEFSAIIVTSRTFFVNNKLGFFNRKYRLSFIRILKKDYTSIRSIEV